MSGEYDELVKRLRAGNFDTESIANEAADAIRALEAELDDVRTTEDDLQNRLMRAEAESYQFNTERDEWKSQCEQWAQKASEWAIEKEKLVDSRDEWKARAETAEARIRLSKDDFYRAKTEAALQGARSRGDDALDRAEKAECRALAAEQSRDALAKAVEEVIDKVRSLMDYSVFDFKDGVESPEWDWMRRDVLAVKAALRSLIKALDNGAPSNG
jgi:chromosome segregation ATPase